MSQTPESLSNNQNLIPFKSRYLDELKQTRKSLEGRKKDFTPIVLERGNLSVSVARHFGFCFGVDRAVEIAYQALAENPDKKVYLLSEMIHNPDVNRDLLNRGVRFIFDTSGRPILNLSNINRNDVVILPAFGVSLEIEKQLNDLGISPTRYDTTCPFVERVWNRAKGLASKGYTIVIHGKPYHEETRATFSRVSAYGPAITIRTIEEAKSLADFIVKSPEIDVASFNELFGDRVSTCFDPKVNLERLAVVNQTTMLAEETSELANIIKVATKEHGSKDDTSNDRFADTKDTLCYATSENQSSVKALLELDADFALVIGGFNSSNTTHLASICNRKFPTYHIRGARDLISPKSIYHRVVSSGAESETFDWLPLNSSKKIHMVITAGASTPDMIVEEVIDKVAEFVKA